jgi:hypothetical protein
MSVSRREFLQLGVMAGFSGLTGFKEMEVKDPRVEAMMKGLERERFLANQTEFVLEKQNGETETVILNNVDFSLTQIKSEQVGETQRFWGGVWNLTGDNVTAWVPILDFYPQKRGWQYQLNALPARSREQSIEPDRAYYSYALLAKETIYDNKVFNILKALNDFRFNALNGFGPGERVSYLDLTQLGEHLKEIGYYLPGYIVGGVADAGGVCASVSTMGKGAYLAEKAGIIKKIERIPHAPGYGYLINPFDPDTVDATAYYNSVGKSLDLILENISQKRLYFVPRADVVLPLMDNDQRLPSSMKKPATCWLAISMALTDVAPTIESSQSVDEALKKFVDYRLKYGDGSRNGFDSR